MGESDKGYELAVLKMVVTQYLNEYKLFTKNNINESETQRDQIVWNIATKIYQQSGHKVELSLVRDLVDFQIKTIKHQVAEEARHIAEQKAQAAAEEAHRMAEAEKARLISESDSQFLSQVTAVIGKFGGDEHKAKVFVRVRKVISEVLGVEESSVTLDSHLSNHLGADENDSDFLVMELEKEFGIEIPDEIAGELLDARLVYDGPSSSWWNPFGISPSSFRTEWGEKYIVRNFVELISQRI